LKVALIDFTSGPSINKDLAGGFGTRTDIGSGLRARLIQSRKQVKLPIMALGYLAAILARAGHDVHYYENCVPNSCDLAIFYGSIVDYEAELAAARRAKEADMKVGFVGTFPSVKPEVFLSVADFVVQGEPYVPLGKLVDQESVPKGIVPGHQISNLDELPFPKWEIFPIERYGYRPMLRGTPFLPVLSSMGCPYSCSYYCPYVVGEGSTWRRRSEEKVIEEISLLKERLQIRSVLFRDPVFTLDQKRARRIAMAIGDLNIEWCVETRIDLVTQDLLSDLRDDGLAAISFGVESPNADILAGIGRSFVEKQEEIICYCENLGIRVAAFYIIGLPGESERDIERTNKYAQKLNSTVGQFCILTPYPSTPFYCQIRDKITTLDWKRFNGYTPVWNHQNLSHERLLELKEKAFVDYYFRWAWLRKHWAVLVPW
jgi:radical SAM superfamily enzyme YgiQ (UPF0313 family)